MSVGSLAAIAFVAALGTRFVTLVATIALAHTPPVSRRVALSGSIVGSLLMLVSSVAVLSSGQPLEGVVVHHAPSGVTLTYAITPLSAWFLFVFDLIAIPVAWYSTSYFAHAVPDSRTTTVSASFVVLLGAVELVFGANDVLTFLFGWELMTLATTALVTADYESVLSRRAAYLYLVMSHVGTGCLVAGFFTLAATTGSLAFADVLSGHVVSTPVTHVLFALFFLGFGVKAGVMPLHVWLPEAHPAAPSSVSALMSAVLITAGVYGLVRICAFGLGRPEISWGIAAMIVGMLSAILGVLYSLTQVDLKRLLAYSTIENAGIMVLGIGAGMVALAFGHAAVAAIAFAAALLHLLNHALFKCVLFLGAGSAVAATGTRQIEQLGGLLRVMPWTGLCFLVGAMAISGLPLFNGFTSEWMSFQALLLGFQSVPGWIRLTFPLGFALLALTSALAATGFVRTFGLSFLALPRSPAAATARESHWAIVLPMAGLAVLCIVIGIFPGVALRPLGGVLGSLPGLPPTVLASTPWMMSTASVTSASDFVAPGLWLSAAVAVAVGAFMFARRTRIRRSPTWGCGGELTSETEYTATAFSKPLLIVFRAVYRPTREVESLAEVSPYFPREVRYRARIEPTFERFIYVPLTRAVVRTADALKVLQAGSLHAYLAYVLVIIVLLLVWLGDAAS